MKEGGGRRARLWERGRGDARGEGRPRQGPRAVNGGAREVGATHTPGQESFQEKEVNTCSKAEKDHARCGMEIIYYFIIIYSVFITKRSLATLVRGAFETEHF